jgi:hypothetical protein
MALKSYKTVTPVNVVYYSTYIINKNNPFAVGFLELFFETKTLVTAVRVLLLRLMLVQWHLV